MSHRTLSKFAPVAALTAAFLFVATVDQARAGTIGRLETAFGTVELTFYDEEKPITVGNFLNYVESGRYENSFLHRLVPGFVVQGGGFTVTDDIYHVPTFNPIQNEYAVGPTYSNVYETIAMAKLGGDANSATSQWFLNLGNNAANLDNQNGGFTVFGHVTSGFEVLTAFNTLFNDANIAQNRIVNASSPFDALPVVKLQGSNIQFTDLFTTSWQVFSEGQSIFAQSSAAPDFLVSKAYDSVISGTLKEKAATRSLTFDDETTLVVNNTLTVSSGTLRALGYAEIRSESRTAALVAPKGQNFTITGNGELRIETVLSGAPVTSLLKNDGGLLTLAAANKYGGGTVINSGTVRLAHAAALGKGGVTVHGQLDLGGHSISLPRLSGTGTVTSSASGSTLTLKNAAAIDFAGQFTGSMNLLKTGKGALILRGNNTHTGGTILQGGRVELGSDTALGTGTLSINAATTLDATGSARTFANNNAQFWNANFTFAGSHTLNMGTGAVVLKKVPVVTVSSSTLTVGGVISGATVKSGLVKSGTGTLALTAANTYAGSTTVKAGVLELSGQGSLASAKITLAKGTTLQLRQDTDWNASGLITGAGLILQDGSATVTLSGANSHKGGTEIRSGILAAGHLKALGGGDVILRDGGTLALGNGLHQAAIAGNLWWENGGQIALTLNADPLLSDWVSVAKGFNSLAGAPLSFAFTIDPELAGQSFRVLAAAKGFGDLGVDDFAALSTDGLFEIRAGLKKSQELWFTYQGEMIPSMMRMTAVPEPSGFALLGLGALALAGWTRRPSSRG